MYICCACCPIGKWTFFFVCCTSSLHCQNVKRHLYWTYHCLGSGKYLEIKNSFWPSNCSGETLENREILLILYFVNNLTGSSSECPSRQRVEYQFLCFFRVTKEHRENLAKNAKTLYNQCKDELRDIQNQYIRKVKRKEGEVSEDLVHDVQLKVSFMFLFLLPHGE